MGTKGAKSVDMRSQTSEKQNNQFSDPFTSIFFSGTGSILDYQPLPNLISLHQREIIDQLNYCLQF